MRLFAPDNFDKNWYGYLTNQVGHVSLGVFVTWGAVLFFLVVAGEFPYKAHIFVYLSSIYALYEITVQGWNKFDTVEDWIFFSLYGVGGTVMTFHEYDRGSSLATFDIMAPSFIFPVIIAHLLIGCGIRKWRSASER